jgi:UDPglucose 6-dehydrogenase
MKSNEYPEFLREVAAMRDFKFSDRIVVGCDDERARKVLADVCRPLSLNEVPMLCTTRCNAELIKDAATKITFTNEMADFARRQVEISRRLLAASDLIIESERDFSTSDLGPADPAFLRTCALIKTAHDHDVSLRILEAVAALNDNRAGNGAQKSPPDTRRAPQNLN